jgi:hypothetical protein
MMALERVFTDTLYALPGNGELRSQTIHGKPDQQRQWLTQLNEVTNWLTYETLRRDFEDAFLGQLEQISQHLADIYMKFTGVDSQVAFFKAFPFLFEIPKTKIDTTWIVTNLSRLLAVPLVWNDFHEPGLDSDKHTALLYDIDRFESDRLKTRQLTQRKRRSNFPGNFPFDWFSERWDDDTRSQDFMQSQQDLTRSLVDLHRLCEDYQLRFDGERSSTQEFPTSYLNMIQYLSELRRSIAARIRNTLGKDKSAVQSVPTVLARNVPLISQLLTEVKERLQKLGVQDAASIVDQLPIIINPLIDMEYSQVEELVRDFRLETWQKMQLAVKHELSPQDDEL